MDPGALVKFVEIKRYLLKSVPAKNEQFLFLGRYLVLISQLTAVGKKVLVMVVLVGKNPECADR